MDNPLPEPALTVPVLVDDPGGESTPSSAGMGDALVRCVYFTFDALEPMPNWRLNLNGLSLPFFMLGLSGIIVGHVGRGNANPGGWFLNPALIESTFDSIEVTRQIIVETGRIYLPHSFLEVTLRRAIKSHDVLRLREDLFSDAFAFSHGRLSSADFASRLDSYTTQSQTAAALAAPLHFSAEESTAFGHWFDEQLGNVRRQELVWASDNQLHPEEDRSRMRF